MVPSSRGLGRGPLKAATRVRISLGSPIKQKKAPKRCLFCFIEYSRGELVKRVQCYIFESAHFGAEM